jgi:uncharacterized protein YprB with RNaseH-like and TPR domain
MKIFNYDYKIDSDMIKEYFDIKENDIFFDIETTGLSKKYSHIYMIGTGKIYNNSYKTTQFFAESVSEERLIINAFLNDLPEYSRLITYNGDRFDIPFVCEKNDQFDNRLKSGYISSLDIYKSIKPLKHFLKLPAMKQKNIETFLGIKREDKYDGGKLIKVYEDYQKRPSDEDEYLLMIHNREDVYGMLPLLKIFKYFEIKNAALNDFSMKNENNSIVFKGKLNICIPSPVRIDVSDMYIIIDKTVIKGICTLHDGKMKHFFRNTADYVYLIDEDKIIPKILSSGIDSVRYRRPSIEECYSYIDVNKIDEEFMISEIKNVLSSI